MKVTGYLSVCLCNIYFCNQHGSLILYSLGGDQKEPYYVIYISKSSYERNCIGKEAFLESFVSCTIIKIPILINSYLEISDDNIFLLRDLLKCGISSVALIDSPLCAFLYCWSENAWDECWCRWKNYMWMLKPTCKSVLLARNVTR